jgi:hypothetical protein
MNLNIIIIKRNGIKFGVQLLFSSQRYRVDKNKLKTSNKNLLI